MYGKVKMGQNKILKGPYYFSIITKVGPIDWFRCVDDRFGVAGTYFEVFRLWEVIYGVYVRK